MRRDADIVVVGAGIVGVATARALGRRPPLRRPARAVRARTRSRIEPRDVPHLPAQLRRRALRAPRSGGRGRVARSREEERGEQLLERVGVLDLGRVAPATARALAACGVPYETLSAEQVAARWPLRLDPGETAVYQRDGGFLYADRAHAALLAAAVDGGGRRPRALARPRAGARPRRSPRERRRRGARRRAPSSSRPAPGRPASSRPSAIELPVVPTRETVVYVELPGAETLPPVIDYGGIPAPGEGGVARPGNSTYSLAAPGRGLKAGLHHAGPVTDPDEAGAARRERRRSGSRGWAASRYLDAGDDAGSGDLHLHEHRGRGRSCSSATVASSSARRAPVTASSSARSSAARSLRSRRRPPGDVDERSLRRPQHSPRRSSRPAAPARSAKPSLAARRARRRRPVVGRGLPPPRRQGRSRPPHDRGHAGSRAGGLDARCSRARPRTRRPTAWRRRFPSGTTLGGIDSRTGWRR